MGFLKNGCARLDRTESRSIAILYSNMYENYSKGKKIRITFIDIWVYIFYYTISVTNDKLLLL